jgi:hypothetical protein
VARICRRRIHIDRQTSRRSDLLARGELLRPRSLQRILGGEFNRRTIGLVRCVQRHVTDVQKLAMLPRRHTRHKDQITMALGRSVKTLWRRSSSTVHSILLAIAVGHCDDALAGRNCCGVVLREVQANAVVMRTELGAGRNYNIRLMAEQPNEIMLTDRE